MKIHQLLNPDLGISITNEEQEFIDQHHDRIKINSLDDHDQRLAQTLVRKGVYVISNDNITLIKNSHERNN
jgi:hypothetical protein